jgi:hypothetical protein
MQKVVGSNPIIRFQESPAQAGFPSPPDLGFAAQPGLDRTKHVGRRQLQTGRTAYGQRGTGERKLCRLAPMGREPFGVRGRPSDAGPSDGAPTALALSIT